MKASGTRATVDVISDFFDPDSWHFAMNGTYSLGTHRFGALIEPRAGKYYVVIGRHLGWGQERDTVAQATFDTLEEAENFGMLIYTQNKPTSVDRTVVKGYPV